MRTNKKVIGTSIPLFSLKSEKTTQLKNGNIEDGILFIDWLAKTKQKIWQMLPINETQLIPGLKKHVNSPYKGYGIGIDPKYLSNPNRKPDQNTLNIFIKENEYWLTDYSLFCALRDEFGTDNWTKWSKDIKDRDKASIEKWKSILKKEMEKYTLLQWKLYTEFEKLKLKTKEKGIKLAGDLQFYLPLNSPLVWKYQKLFAINSDGSLRTVSGIPHKENAMYGRQVWGHPLYKWNYKDFNKQINDLFILRIRNLANLFDMIRIDHANGFFSFGVININNPRHDYSASGPGISTFKYLVKKAMSLGLLVYAEDAGYDLEYLRTAMHELSVPGIRVLRCAYDNEHNLFSQEHADIHNYPANCVAYTSTHDTETLSAYIQNLNTDQRLKLAEMLKIGYSPDYNKMVTNLISAVLNSKANYIIIPLQDWLSTTERINTPGTEKNHHDPNWNYRMTPRIEDLPLININI